MSEIVTMTRAEHEALLDRIEELEDLMKVKAVEAAVAAAKPNIFPPRCSTACLPAKIRSRSGGSTAA